jgi:hypothetical protein
VQELTYEELIRPPQLLGKRFWYKQNGKNWHTDSKMALIQTLTHSLLSLMISSRQVHSMVQGVTWKCRLSMLISIFYLF